jgi:hypothetical protein
VRVTDAGGANFSRSSCSIRSSATARCAKSPTTRRRTPRSIRPNSSRRQGLRPPDAERGRRAPRRARQVISPEIIDAAERLCIVEHTDHKRFKTEDHASLYNEIFTLYALNAGDTYRFSVSSAGAGGMVQMIPPTTSDQEMHPAVGSTPISSQGCATTRTPSKPCCSTCRERGTIC